MVQKEGQFKGYPLRTYVGNNFQGVKTNIGKGGALNKLDTLLGNYSFCNVQQAAESIDWNKQPLIEL